MTQQELIDIAFKASENAYVPYSHFPVGAAVLCKDGSVYKGCNIENAAYPSGICGERVAIFNAISDGKRADDIQAIAIVAHGNTIAYSCGACRQVLVELCHLDTPVYFSNGQTTLTTTVGEMSPYPFTAKDLD